MKTNNKEYEAHVLWRMFNNIANVYCVIRIEHCWNIISTTQLRMDRLNKDVWHTQQYTCMENIGNFTIVHTGTYYDGNAVIYIYLTDNQQNISLSKTPSIA